VSLDVLRGGRVVKRYRARTASGLVRLRLPARGPATRRGVYRFRLRAAAHRTTVTAVLAARRL
jgi:hypothetical protein